MSDTRKKLGDFGEQAALAHLTRRGWHLVARKWRCAIGEIDLVLREEATLVFVEVRTRRGTSDAAESISATKQQRLIALAYTYLESESIPDDQPWRIDVVAVNLDSHGRIARLNHLRDAVEE